MQASDIELAKRLTTGPGDMLANQYRMASWLCSQRLGWWSSDAMLEVKEALGISPSQIDDEVADGIGGLLAADGRILRRGPRLPKHLDRMTE